MKKVIFLIPVLAILVFSCKKKTTEVIDNSPLTVKDADGNVYNTVQIGNQIWMKENLKTTKFNDGTPITKYDNSMSWASLVTPQAFYQWAGTSNISGVYPNPLPFDYYGALYNHFAFESGKLAPTGWRIPTEQDFLTLKTYLTNNGFAGKEAVALKSNFGWATSSGNGSDAVGFKGLPNGYVSIPGSVISNEIIANWATSTITTTTTTSSTRRILVTLFDKDTISMASNAFPIGAGVRCIKN